MWTHFKAWFKRQSTGRQYAVVLGAGFVVLVLAAAVSGGGSKKDTNVAAKTEPPVVTTAPPETVATAKPVKTTSVEATEAPKAPTPAATSKPTTPSRPAGDPEVDRNTRAYVRQMEGCEVAVTLIRQVLKDSSTDLVALADSTTQARDICDSARSTLVSLSTDHFDDQAALGFDAIDRYKSGLNAVLAYIDNPRPTKVIEARNKLQQGDEEAAQAHHQINQRRHVYGLKALRS
jgi:hypothetical protein